MLVHKIAIDGEIGRPAYRFLMSDLHLGSPSADHDAIRADLAMARAVGARVLINGDVFDAIGPTDKRFDAGTLHPDVRGKKDLARAIVDLAEGVLAPFREIIDVIGIGNHEEAWIKYNHGDPVGMLLDRLNVNRGERPAIRHGSFWGYITTSFKIDGHRRRPIHRLLYLHGTGGDSPVTKGTIDFNRKGRNWQYDALTFGHKHNKVVSEEAIMSVTDAGAVVERIQLNLQTASYYRNYRQLGIDEPLDYGYAASKAHPPKPLGGLFLAMTPRYGTDGRPYIHQSFASEVRPEARARRAA